MIIDMFLAAAGLAGILGIVTALKGFQYSAIVRYSALCPDHPKLPFARVFVDRFGGTMKVDSAASTGIVVSLLVIGLAAATLILRAQLLSK